MSSWNIEELIPHRPPFLLVDAITELEPGVSARGYWDLTGEEAFFAGHFPGRPTLPGVLIAESLAQLGAAMVLADKNLRGKVPLLAGIDNARFRRQVVPGDRLELRAEMGRISTRAGTSRGIATVRGELCCELTVLFILASE